MPDKCAWINGREQQDPLGPETPQHRSAVQVTDPLYRSRIRCTGHGASGTGRRAGLGESPGASRRARRGVVPVRMESEGRALGPPAARTSLVRDERYGTREAIELLAVCLVLNLWIDLELQESPAARTSLTARGPGRPPLETIIGLLEGLS